MGQAGVQWNELHDDASNKVPIGVSAIVATNKGVGMIWEEGGEESYEGKISDFVLRLRQKAEEICL